MLNPSRVPLLRCQSTDPGSPVHPFFCPTWLQIWEFSWSLLRLDNSHEQLTGLKKTLHLHLPVYYKRHNSGTAQGKRYVGQRIRVGVCRASVLFLGMPPSQHLSVSNPETLYMLSLRVLMKAPLYRHNWWSHWSVVIELDPQPISFPQRSWGGAKSSQLLIQACFWWPVPTLKLSRLLTHTAGVISLTYKRYSCHLGDSKCVSSVLRTGEGPNTNFLLRHRWGFFC